MVNLLAETAAAESSPAKRAVLLGASNLSRGLPAVLDTVLCCSGGPAEVFLAAGRGRSYGVPSSFLGRTLPGIVHCGLWDALAEQPPLPTVALLTDIGNDLLYEVPVPQIAGWVEACLDRLLGMQALPVITALPLANLAGLSPARYRFFKTILFRRAGLSLEQARERARQLDTCIRELAQSREVALIEPRAAWYGYDPIHIRFRDVPAAWCEILTSWNPEAAAPARGISWLTWCRLQRLKPQRRWLLNVEQHTQQPVLRRADGTTLWLY